MRFFETQYYSAIPVTNADILSNPISICKIPIMLVIKFTSPSKSFIGSYPKFGCPRRSWPKAERRWITQSNITSDSIRRAHPSQRPRLDWQPQGLVEGYHKKSMICKSIYLLGQKMGGHLAEIVYYRRLLNYSII